MRKTISACLEEHFPNSSIIFLPESGFFMQKKSPIHGIGCFAVKEIQERVCMGVSLIRCDKEPSVDKNVIIRERRAEFSDKRKTWENVGLVRYINHSKNPNLTSFLHSDGIIMFKALQDIRVGDEVTIDYEPIYKMVGAVPMSFFTT